MEGGPVVDRPASQVKDDEEETAANIYDKIDAIEIEEEKVKEHEESHAKKNKNDNTKEERKAKLTETKSKLFPIFQAAKSVGNVATSKITLTIHTQKPHMEANNLDFVQEAFNPFIQEAPDQEASPSHCILLTNIIFQEIKTRYPCHQQDPQ